MACATPQSDVTSTHLPAPTLDELRNATYTGIDERLKTVALHDGRWSGEPAAPGAASRPLVELAGDFRVVGDLDGDRQDEAVAVLTYSTGGSGVLSYLAVVTRKNGTPRSLATTLLGDRVQIRSVRIDGDRLIASVVRAGDKDPACCGGELVEWQWTLGKDRLNAVVTTITGRLSLDTISGTVWTLHAWDLREPAQSPPTVTLAYESGRFTGSSGCNRYFGGAKGTDTPGEISVGVLAGTRTACPERESAAEARFLEQLGGASKFGFVLGRLAISYARTDGSVGTMLFDASSP
jgi:heat shock protein HslJ